MMKNWSMGEIESQLKRIHWACSDPRMDGFVTWGCKQDLYRIKFLVEELLEKCPTYSIEDQWLEEREKQKVWETLNQTK